MKCSFIDRNVEMSYVAGILEPWRSLASSLLSVASQMELAAKAASACAAFVRLEA